MHEKSLKIPTRFNPNKLRECAYENRDEKLAYVARGKILVERDIILSRYKSDKNIYPRFQCEGSENLSSKRLDSSDAQIKRSDSIKQPVYDFYEWLFNMAHSYVSAESIKIPIVEKRQKIRYKINLKPT